MRCPGWNADRQEEGGITMIYPVDPRGRSRRRGMAAVQVALTLTALLGIAAIALDGGILLAERRHVQAAADAAALAGATDLFANFSTNQGTDPSGTAAAAARDYATQNYAPAFQANLRTPITVN